MQEKTRDQRIASMFSGDRLWSYAALLMLWLLYAFVFAEVLPYLTSPEIFWLLAVGGGLVLLFNSASILVMIAHLSDVRDEVYGLDIHYLDASQNTRNS